MKKSNNYAPYLFAFFITVYFVIQNNLLLNPSVVAIFGVLFLALFGLWLLNEQLLNISDNVYLKWGCMIVGNCLYFLCFFLLDYYVLHLLMHNTGFSLGIFGLKYFQTMFLSVLIIEGTNWTKAREQSKIENLSLQAENMEAQFNALIQQVNPDFLFHSLDTLQKMVRADDPQAENYILKLADVYRQTLQKDRTTASLHEELAFLRSYIYLMTYGQEEAVVLDIKVSDAALGYQLPVFSLQLLGEICLKHNVFSSNQPLNIKIFQKKPKTLTIFHNYLPQTMSTESMGVAIENLILRYALLGIENAVGVEQNETTYLTTIKLI
jgi:two-component system, LytTR family, sensor kinase